MEFIIYNVGIVIYFSVPWGQGFCINVNSSGVITKVCVFVCLCVCVCAHMCMCASDDICLVTVIALFC